MERALRWYWSGGGIHGTGAVYDNSLVQQHPQNRGGNVGTQSGQDFGEKESKVSGRLGTRHRSRT